MKTISNSIALVLAALAAAPLAAADTEPAWLQCAQLERERRLECYDQASQRYLAERATPDTREDGRAPEPLARQEKPKKFEWRLDDDWPVGNEIADAKALAGLLLQYRRNYLMIDSVHAPASAPASSNPLNQVPAGPVPRQSETKLQVSVKARLPVTWPWGDSAWVAYTQQSHWQSFNGSDSRPFRETNYEPEIVFLSHRFPDWMPTLGKLTPRVANFSYVHQSNGQPLPRSRSWNRLTAEFGGEYRFDDDDEQRLTVMLKPWWRVPDRRGNDDNPDIVDYLGHGEVTLNYWGDRAEYSVVLRERSYQLEWAFPLWIKALNSANLHLQYFNGYGHSLIDYNHKLHSFGVGISLPY